MLLQIGTGDWVADLLTVLTCVGAAFILMLLVSGVRALARGPSDKWQPVKAFALLIVIVGFASVFVGGKSGSIGCLGVGILSVFLVAAVIQALRSPY